MEATQQHRENKYLFEIFEAPHAEFECRFTEFLNQKDSSGWEYEDCKFLTEGDNCRAL